MTLYVADGKEKSMADDEVYSRGKLWFDENTSYPDVTRCYMCRHHEDVFKGNILEYTFCTLAVKEACCNMDEAVVDDDFPFVCDRFEREEEYEC